ncbi:MAG: LysM peptidoglycan-binding domain-containing protein [Phycisphaerae bacterium]
MRTEVKVGIAVGLVAIVGLVLYTAMNSGGDKAIPFDPQTSKATTPTPANAKPPAGAPPRTDAARPPGSTPRTEPLRPATTSTPPRPIATPSSGAAAPSASGSALPPRDAPPGATDARPATPSISPPTGTPPASGSTTILDPTTRPASESLRPITSAPPPDAPAPTTSAPPRPVATPPLPAAAGTPATSTPPPGPATPASGDTGSAVRTPTSRTDGTKHTIKDGDTLAKIAADAYGAERYWQAILDANPGLDPNRLMVGKTIVLPARDAVVKAVTTPARPSPSDSSAARPPNGTSSATPGTRAPSGPAGLTAAERLRLANTPPAARGSTPANGTGPAPPPSAPPSTGGERAPTLVGAAAPGTYTVVRGDSLASIARRLLSSESRWRAIYELNRDKLARPEELREGMVLKLPADATTGATTRGARRP